MHHYAAKKLTGFRGASLEAVGEVRTKKPKLKGTRRTVATQSMTTYARGRQQPRFILTPTACEGCWSQDERLDRKDR
eukprot:4939965-Pyramimonas_sp.AAC.1